RLHLRQDVRRRRRQHALGNSSHQASSTPSVTAAIRRPPLPRLPQPSGVLHSLAPRSHQPSPTPRPTPALPHPLLPLPPPRPPPSVFTGKRPPRARRPPSATNSPPLPFSQKPRSSIVSTTVMVNES